MLRPTDLLFKRNRITLISPLPVQECARLLLLSIDGSGSRRSKKPVIGYIGGNVLNACKRIRYRNDLQTMLKATMKEVNGRTLFFCTFAMAPAAIAFMCLWFGILLYIGLFIVLPSLWSQAGRADMHGGIGQGGITLLLMFAVGTVLLKLGRFLARGEQKYLVDFLRQTVEARPYQGDGNESQGH